MRLRSVVLGCIWLSLTAAALADDRAAPEREADAVGQATAKLRALPELGVYESKRVLRWKAQERERPKPKSDAGLRWLRDFLGWFSEAGRMLMWAVGAIAAVSALWWTRHWLKPQPARRPLPMQSAPTHVGALDIRPDRLPDDVGAAAWLAWQGAQDRSQRRAALSLLYRGALSRLVHQFGIPIAAASTENECVALAQRSFEQDAQAGPARSDFVRQLVDVWQRAVYGLQQPSDALMQTLCANFAQQLTGSGVRADVA